jgi:hypothetical protein
MIIVVTFSSLIFVSFVVLVLILLLFKIKDIDLDVAVKFAL